MPGENSLAEPAVDASQLHPERFGYSGETTELAIEGCEPAIEWSLGQLDPRFGLGRLQAIRGIERGAAIWNRAAGRALFRYSPQSRFRIDFIYDERQEMLIKMESGNRDPFDEVMARYQALEGARNRDMAAHAQRNQAYEEAVRAFESEGGTEARRARLNAERLAINQEARRLNGLRARIGALAMDINSRSRSLTADDLRFVKAGFTKRAIRNGVVRAIRMEIYMFSSWESLPRIVAHEFGHVLGMQHLGRRGAIMTEVAEGDEATKWDIDELNRVCSE